MPTLDITELKITTATNMNLLYINTSIQNEHSTDAEPISVLALKDNGCNTSCISQEFFDKINYNLGLAIHKTEIPIATATTEGNKTGETTSGYTPVRLALEGTNGACLKVETKLWIIPNLKEDIIIGQNILASPEKIYETNEIMKFKLEKGQEITIPLIKKKTNTPPKTTTTNTLLSINEITIEPFQSSTVFTRPNNEYGTDKPGIMAFDNLPDQENRKYKVVPTYLDMDTPMQRLTITIMNPTQEPITIYPDEYIATMDPINDQADPEVIDIKRIQLSTKLTDKEIDKIEDELDEKGYTVLPATDSFTDKYPMYEVPEKGTEYPELKVDLSHLTGTTKAAALSLITKNKNLLQRHDMEFRSTDIMEATVDLKPVDKIRNQRYIPIHHNLRDEVAEIIRHMKDNKIIEDSDEATPFLSSLLMAKKKSGKVRILLDLRVVNSYTQRKQTDSISQYEILTAIGSGKYFTSIDISNAFFSMPIKKEDRKYFSFLDHNKNPMRFAKLPQGWSNSCAFLNILMSRILRGITHTIFYVDDILIYGGNTQEEHLELVDKVLQALKAAKILVKPSKLQILAKEIEFLGIIYKTTDNQDVLMSIPADKVRAYKEKTKPKTKKQLLGLLSSVSYYRRFIPNMADITKPLHDMVYSDSAAFKWTPLMDAAYTKLLQEVALRATINCPNPNKEYICFSDSSDIALSFILYQYDNNNDLKIVHCMSKKHSEAYCKNHIYNKELNALVEGLKTYSYLLKHAKKVTCYVDNKALLYLQATKDESAQQSRRALFLSGFNLELRHISGKDNITADYLSRYHADYEGEPDKIYNAIRDKEAKLLIDALVLGHNILTPEFVTKMLENQTRIPAPVAQQKRKSYARSRSITTEDKLRPVTKPERKIKMPHTVSYSSHLPYQKEALQDTNFFQEQQEKPTPVATAPRQPGESYTNPILESEEEKEYQKLLGVLGRRKAKPPPIINIRTLLIPDGTIRINVTTRAETNSLKMDSIMEEENNPTGNPRRLTTTIPPTPEEIIDTPNLDNPNEITNPTPGPSRTNPTPTTPADIPNEDTITGQPSMSEWTILAHQAQGHPITPAEMRTLQQQDQTWITIMENLDEHPQFHIRDGLLRYKHEDNTDRIALPTSLVEHLITLHHYTKLGIHAGATKIAQTMKTNYHHPHILNMTKQIVQNCGKCQLTKNRGGKKKQEFGIQPTPTGPRQKYSMDFVPGLPETPRGNKVCLLITDMFSNVTRYYALKSRAPQETIEAIKQLLQADCITSPTIRSDRDTSFSSNEMTEFFASRDITQEMTAAHAQFSNGSSELFVKAFKEYLKNYLTNDTTNWDLELDLLPGAKARFITTHGYTPEIAHYGTAVPSKLLPGIDIPVNLDDFQERTQTMHEKILTNREAHKERMMTYRNQTRTKTDYEKGDLVIYHRPPQGDQKAVKISSQGPYRITDQQPDSLAVTLEHANSKRLCKAHTSNIMKYTGLPNHILADNWDTRLTSCRAN